MELFQLLGEKMTIPTNSGIHYKKLEVDLTLKRSSQLQSGFIQVQVVVHLLLQGFRVTPHVQCRFLANNELGCKMKSIL